MDNGDVETLRKLDVEAEELAAEVEVLRSLQDRLRKCVDETKAGEFLDAMPVAFTEFGKLLKAQTEAQEKARLARQAVDSKLSEIRGLREHVVLHGRSEVKRNQPLADPELLHQYMAVMG